MNTTFFSLQVGKLWCEFQVWQLDCYNYMETGCISSLTVVAAFAELSRCSSRQDGSKPWTVLSASLLISHDLRLCHLNIWNWSRSDGQETGIILFSETMVTVDIFLPTWILLRMQRMHLPDKQGAIAMDAVMDR